MPTILPDVAHTHICCIKTEHPCCSNERLPNAQIHLKY